MQKSTLKIILFALLLTPIIQQAFANNTCFIAMENGKIIKEQGACDQRHSPYSTFKVPIALMGFESKILKDSNHPLVQYSPEIQQQYKPYFHPERYPIMFLSARDQTPESWLRYSVIWYSQYITKKLGKGRFQDFVNRFNYGNKNITGDEKYHNGLNNAWLGTSLQISAREQVNFIEKLRQQTLSISQEAQSKTIQILRLNLIFDDWQLYGKTGGPVDSGWFVGWIEKNGRSISFAQYIEQPANSLLTGGRIAKEVAIDNLTALVFGNL